MKYVRAVDKSRSEEQHQILKLARELGKGPGGDGETNSPESAFEDDVRDRLSRRFQETGLQHLDVESHVGCERIPNRPRCARPRFRTLHSGNRMRWPKLPFECERSVQRHLEARHIGEVQVEDSSSMVAELVERSGRRN